MADKDSAWELTYPTETDLTLIYEGAETIKYEKATGPTLNRVDRKLFQDILDITAKLKATQDKLQAIEATILDKTNIVQTPVGTDTEKVTSQFAVNKLVMKEVANGNIALPSIVKGTMIRNTSSGSLYLSLVNIDAGSMLNDLVTNNQVVCLDDLAGIDEATVINILKNYIGNSTHTAAVENNVYHLGTRDLNTVVENGYYIQEYDAEATLARNYPGIISDNCYSTDPNSSKIPDAGAITSCRRGGVLVVYNFATRTVQQYVIQKYIDLSAEEYIRIFLYNTETSSIEMLKNWERHISTAELQCLLNKGLGTGVPAGTIISSASKTIPTGYLYCNGQAVSRTTYANLYKAIGTSFGAGNGSTTFNVPDLRGMFLRGWDNGRGVDSGRAWGSRQEDATQKISARLHTVDDQAIVRADQSPQNPFYISRNYPYDASSEYSGGGKLLSFDNSRAVRTANEERPKNIAINYYICTGN